jgi:hypothetical protein
VSAEPRRYFRSFFLRRSFGGKGRKTELHLPWRAGHGKARFKAEKLARDSQFGLCAGPEKQLKGGAVQESYGQILTRIWKAKKDLAVNLGLDYEGFDNLNLQLIRSFLHNPNNPNTAELKAAFEEYLAENGLTLETARVLFTITPN